MTWNPQILQNAFTYACEIQSCPYLGPQSHRVTFIERRGSCHPKCITEPQSASLGSGVGGWCRRPGVPPLILNFNRLPQGSAADSLWTTLFDALEQIMPGPVSCIIHMQPQKKIPFVYILHA